MELGTCAKDDRALFRNKMYFYDTYVIKIEE